MHNINTGKSLHLPRIKVRHRRMNRQDEKRVTGNRDGVTVVKIREERRVTIMDDSCSVSNHTHSPYLSSHFVSGRFVLYHSFVSLMFPSPQI